MLDTNFGDLTQDVDVTITAGGGDSGLVFRATGPAVGTDSCSGCYAGVSPRGRVLLGRADHGWTPWPPSP